MHRRMSYHGSWEALRQRCRLRCQYLCQSLRLRGLYVYGQREYI
jgi:hypothetical protein